MAGLLYASTNPERIANGVEALLRKEIGSPAPLPYQIFTAQGQNATAKSVLADFGRSLASIKQNSVILFTIQFNLYLPRPFTVQISVTRYGLGAIVSKFAYTVPLNKRIPGAVQLSPTRFGGGKGYIGDPTVAAWLNNNGPVTVQSHRLAVSKSKIGRYTLTIQQRMEIVPSQSGSVLILHRLGVPGFLSGVNIGARDLLNLVPQIEASLP